MLDRKITKTAATAGHAEGSTPLNAFDNALLSAGLGNVNLLKISSIIPPDVDFVALPQIKPGSLIPTAYAAITSQVPGELISAAVGYALPADRTKAGVIMEYHDVAPKAEAEQAVRQMLEEAFSVRGETIRELAVMASEHRVERLACAFAAVALFSEEDLIL
ncbi:MAG: pyruvoyl-dependent arginine decarboxylase [Candidatus Methylomirabilia bacterium]